MNILQTALGALTITPAQPDELPIVMEILDQAAAWLHTRGITGQWPPKMSERAWQHIGADIDKGQVNLARLANGDAVGTMRFEWSEPYMWRDDPDGGGYVHSLAIRPAVHGHGIGAAMIEWAKQHVREQGRKYLRLDCWAENLPLRDYYARLGFTFCGIVEDNDDASVLWQMPV